MKGKEKKPKTDEGIIVIKQKVALGGREGGREGERERVRGVDNAAVDS